MFKSAALHHPWGWSSLVPVACAIHCLAGPILVLALPAAAFSERAEWLLLAGATAVALLALTAGIRAHGKWQVVAVAALGLLVWYASLAGGFGRTPEEWTTAAGSLLVAAALLRNSRLQCRAPEGSCEACDLSETSARDQVEPLKSSNPFKVESSRVCG